MRKILNFLSKVLDKRKVSGIIDPMMEAGMESIQKGVLEFVFEVADVYLERLMLRADAATVFVISETEKDEFAIDDVQCGKMNREGFSDKEIIQKALLQHQGTPGALCSFLCLVTEGKIHAILVTEDVVFPASATVYTDDDGGIRPGPFESGMFSPWQTYVCALIGALR